ncbi:MAG TPA: hypothetical protein VIK64_05270, partial [Anaerolineales bacterium]
MSEAQRVAASFRDPSGFLFTRDGDLFRQANQAYGEEYDRLIGSGLYDALVGDGLLIPHEEVEVQPFWAENAYKIIK